LKEKGRKRGVQVSEHFMESIWADVAQEFSKGRKGEGRNLSTLRVHQKREISLDRMNIVGGGTSRLTGKRDKRVGAKS